MASDNEHDSATSGDGSVTASQATEQQTTNDLETDPTYDGLGQSQFGDVEKGSSVGSDADPLEKGEATLTAADDSAFGAATATQDGGRPDGNPNALVEGNIVADEDGLDPKKG
jgi:hypothetical protein